MKPFQGFADYIAFCISLSGDFKGENREQEPRARTEEGQMSDGLVNSRSGRSAALAALASLVLVAASASPSMAAPAKPASDVAARSSLSAATDFSAARRHRYYRRGPSAAGLAFMGMATGLIAGAIAESRRQEYYDNRYYYGGYYGGPRTYYDPGYGYYGGPRYYYNPY
jgi:hypothetical protein